MRIILLATFLVLFVASVHSSCSSQSTCKSCASYSACYWCAASGKCEDYLGEKVADFLCPNKWIQHHSLCPVPNKDNQLNQLLRMLNENEQPSSASSNVDQGESGGTGKELKELLNKILLLKLLRKIKSEGMGSLSEEDKNMLGQLSSLKLNQQQTTTTTLKPDHEVGKEIKQLLSLLHGQTENTEKPTLANIPTAKSPLKETSTSPSKSTNDTLTKKPVQSVMSLLKNIDEQNAGVVYEENKTEGIAKPPAKSTNTSQEIVVKSNSTMSNPKTTARTTTRTAIQYCGLYQEIDICNSDRNCTWCNTRDMCISRSGNEYSACVDSKDKILDKEYGLDKCLALKHCKQCVENSKCYWCDVSKSCHTYPFFGYVPESCGGDWYVKQCDVQLAVIIIVLPLIIILLAMITFYFCLKYCYYRRKVLRVPLFEKPGVFDYRKDKKVYYVNPEDESSDNEMAAEKIRKKYRLPVEREPLIDPNS